MSDETKLQESDVKLGDRFEDESGDLFTVVYIGRDDYACEYDEDCGFAIIGNDFKYLKQHCKEQTK